MVERYRAPATIEIKSANLTSFWLLYFVRNWVKNLCCVHFVCLFLKSRTCLANIKTKLLYFEAHVLCKNNPTISTIKDWISNGLIYFFLFNIFLKVKKSESIWHFNDRSTWAYCVNPAHCTENKCVQRLSVTSIRIL